jgi:nitrogen fixation NifU-like protein
MSDSMYQEIILDHYRRPKGRGLREPFDVEVHHVNPTCGDEITLRVRLSGNEIDDVSYEGMGCSISQASASVLYELVDGKNITQALATGDDFRTLMQSKATRPSPRSWRIPWRTRLPSPASPSIRPGSSAH